jgi:hypothetical protein
MEVEEGVRNTQELLKLLDRRGNDPQWQDEFDELFRESLFCYDRDQPFFFGPDGLTYYGLHLPTKPCVAIKGDGDLDNIVHFVTGAAIMGANGEGLNVYSPGDMVSFKLFGKSWIHWGGHWEDDPDIKAYEAGGELMTGLPSEQMLPNLVLRSLEFGLRIWYKVNVEDSAEMPSITLARLSKHTQDEDPSELILRMPTSIRKPGEEKRNEFIKLACYFVPRHLWNRLIAMPAEAFSYTPLEELMKERGIEPAPDR